MARSKSKKKARKNPQRRTHRGPNFVAILISFAAVTLLYFNFHPTPVGADPNGRRTNIDALAAINVPPPPPLPTSKGAGAGLIAKSDSKINGQSSGTQASSSSTASVSVSVMSGRLALLFHLKMLEIGGLKLERVSDYTATFAKQERVDGTLTDRQVMQIKMRHAPFSVYMKWLVGNKGRQVLYVDGQNEGKMLVQLGGWKSRFPALKLDPNGKIALKESRYPITKAGLLELVRTAIDYRRHDLKNFKDVRCHVVEDQEFDKRNCYAFVIEYVSPKASETYRKCVTYIDKELSVPILVKNFAWPDESAAEGEKSLDESTLVEYYSFSDIKLELKMANSEFDRKNKIYKFR